MKLKKLEYVNASSSYMDDDMAYAGSCIALAEKMLLEKRKEKSAEIVECESIINREKDFIRAIKLIAHFDYSLLPIQVGSRQLFYFSKINGCCISIRTHFKWSLVLLK